MTKKEIEMELTYYRVKKKELLESVDSLRKDLEVMKAQIEELKGEGGRHLIPRKILTKNCRPVKDNGLVGTVFFQRICRTNRLSEDTHGGELENSVMQALKIARVNNEKFKFHTIHQLDNNKTVIAKLITQWDAIK